jgi:hypothetical protein
VTCRSNSAARPAGGEFHAAFSELKGDLAHCPSCNCAVAATEERIEAAVDIPGIILIALLLVSMLRSGDRQAIEERLKSVDG